jgi:hypothetical protein
MQHKKHGDKWRVWSAPPDYTSALTWAREIFRSYYKEGFAVAMKPHGLNTSDFEGAALEVVSPEQQIAERIEHIDKALRSSDTSGIIDAQKSLTELRENLESVLLIIDGKQEQVNKRLKGWIGE